MQRSRVRLSRLGSMFALEWAAANVVGGAIGWALFSTLYDMFSGAVGGANQGSSFRAVSGALTWAVVWGVLGTTQAIAIRGIVPRPWLWAMGWLAAGIMFGSVAEQVFAAQIGVDVGFGAGAAAGLVAGVVQWWTLRTVSRWALAWVPLIAILGALASGFGMTLLAPVLQQVNGSLGMAWAICGGAAGMLLGMGSGLALIWLLQQRAAV